jgi:protocatechuate 3,4-dioxygenase alpha subunit
MPRSRLKETPSQTAGPFVHIGTVPAAAGLRIRSDERLNILAGTGAPGERITIEGIIHDGSGKPVTDAMIEIWQADGEGRYGAAFAGWGRAACDFETGLYRFETIKPGCVPFHDGRLQAPHVALSIFARGINIHLQTRMYFPEEAVANAADPALAAVGEPVRIETLIARRQDRGNELAYRFDIHLQGERETVFFDF